MIIAHLYQETLKSFQITPDNFDLVKKAVWVDLISPSREEEIAVEKTLNVDIPTRDEMVEIELSNRLYREHNTIFMTASIIAQVDKQETRVEPVSFVLTETQLITIRYVDPKYFKIFTNQLDNTMRHECDAIVLLTELLDSNINRIADILELIGRGIDEYSRLVFMPHTAGKRPNYLSYMQEIGFNGTLNTKVRESLLTFQRLIPYLHKNTTPRCSIKVIDNIITMENDVVALNEHANFLSNKITFLLEATLGMVNIEQNNIIKLFSVAAVIFLPPTLVASVYGMNFNFMPELNWKFGYIFALVIMLLAAWLPYKYFKYRKWL